jgi:hypothetical protein
MSDTYQLYVAKSPETGLYLTRAQNFLIGNKGWIDAAKPSDAEVAAEIMAADKRQCMWTADLNEADVWSAPTISNIRRYLPPVDFVGVNLTTEPRVKRAN